MKRLGAAITCSTLNFLSVFHIGCGERGIFMREIRAVAGNITPRLRGCLFGTVTGLRCYHCYSLGINASSKAALNS